MTKSQLSTPCRDAIHSKLYRLLTNARPARSGLHSLGMAATKRASPKPRARATSRADATRQATSRAPTASKRRATDGGAASSPGLKTTVNDAPVKTFLARATTGARLADCHRLLELMTKVSGATPKMWGASIVGFGTYRYKYASGREGDWPPIAFSPRKRDLTIYATPGLDNYHDQLAQLGTFTRGVSCLHVKQLDDIDLGVLEEILRDSFRRLTVAAT